LAIDREGNVFVAGTSYSSAWAVATAKYAPNGIQLWLARYRTNTNGDEESATSAALDSVGSVYVTGFSYGRGPDYPACVTLKYDPTGSLKWFGRHNGGGSVGLGPDTAGNVYVVGFIAGSSGGDYLVLQYVQPPGIGLSSPTVLPNGQFRFTLAGDGGRIHTIQASTNLVNWTALTNLASVTATNQFTDPTAPDFSRRLYRAVTQ